MISSIFAGNILVMEDSKISSYRVVRVGITSDDPQKLLLVVARYDDSVHVGFVFCAKIYGR